MNDKELREACLDFLRTRVQNPDEMDKKLRAACRTFLEMHSPKKVKMWKKHFSSYDGMGKMKNVTCRGNKVNFKKCPVNGHLDPVTLKCIEPNVSERTWTPWNQEIKSIQLKSGLCINSSTIRDHGLLIDPVTKEPLSVHDVEDSIAFGEKAKPTLKRMFFNAIKGFVPVVEYKYKLKKPSATRPCKELHVAHHVGRRSKVMQRELCKVRPECFTPQCKIPKDAEVNKEIQEREKMRSVFVRMDR